MDDNEKNFPPNSPGPTMSVGNSDSDPCPSIMAAAQRYYAQPLSNLHLRKPLDVLHKESGSQDPMGQWVTGVPRPGDVAACVHTNKPPNGGRSR